MNVSNRTQGFVLDFILDYFQSFLQDESPHYHQRGLFPSGELICHYG